MQRYLGFTLFCLTVLCVQVVMAQNSAPSSHLVFDDNFAGDILINEVRVPKSGEALYTYYEALGWRGTGAGYAGIQSHPKAHNFIFSIWDHRQHTAPISAVFRGPGTEAVGFGGEGTGLKSWNFELGWSTDVWYTLVARNWPVGEHTHFGFWVRAGDTKKWTHLVTMDVAVAGAHFQGGTDAFIEDWSSSGTHARTTHLRGGWKRSTDGSWFPFGKGRYSVNAWDLVEGKRSYNYRTRWNGGTARDETGEFYFMTSGGKKTVSATENPSTHAIARNQSEPDFETIRITEAHAARDAERVTVRWKVSDVTTPQFAYRIELHDNRAGAGEPLLAESRTRAEVRESQLDITALGLPATKEIYAHLQLTDLFDRSSATVVVPVFSAP